MLAVITIVVYCTHFISGCVQLLVPAQRAWHALLPATCLPRKRLILHIDGGKKHARVRQALYCSHRKDYNAWFHVYIHGHHLFTPYDIRLHMYTVCIYKDCMYSVHKIQLHMYLVPSALNEIYTCARCASEFCFCAIWLFWDLVCDKTLAGHWANSCCIN